MRVAVKLIDRVEIRRPLPIEDVELIPELCSPHSALSIDLLKSPRMPQKSSGFLSGTLTHTGNLWENGGLVGG
jgi:hypothetical protein